MYVVNRVGLCPCGGQNSMLLTVFRVAWTMDGCKNLLLVLRTNFISKKEVG